MPAFNIAKKIAISIIGGTVLLFGVVMIVMPGPAFVVIPAGLAILAIEFTWARRWLHKMRALIAQATNQNSQPSANPHPGRGQSNQPL